MEGPYAERLGELRARVREGGARSGRISSWRGLTFLTTVASGALCLFGAVPAAGWAACGVAGAIFLALVVAHARLVTEVDDLELRVKLLEQGQRRAACDLASLAPAGERFRTDADPYARDLDLFGAGSLFQLVGAAETGPGAELVARWLCHAASREEILARQAAVRELADKPRFREDLAALGTRSESGDRAADRFIAWVESPTEGPSPAQTLVAALLVLATAATYAVSYGLHFAGLFRNVWLLPFAAQLAWLARLKNPIAAVLGKSPADAAFGRYVAILGRIASERFDDPRLEQLRAAVVDAPAELTTLETRMNFASAGRNGLGALGLNSLFLWNAFTASSLGRWRQRAGSRVRGWVAALAEMDALSSLASFAAEHPSFTFPEIVPDVLRLEAEGLGHPLIPAEKRVDNDIALAGPGHAFLITGSNMSGKSTLLRAIGVNAVLALAGAPVCAKRLSLGVCEVHTSMRVADSLDRGISHFYAELERLKQVVDATTRGAPVLFLLDEVLHGTNSRERILGAKAIVRHLLAKGAIGGVTSHDLGLAVLEDETDGRVRNVHLEELVDGSRMTFDYKLKSGVVNSSNALRLMRVVGIDVEVDEEEPHAGG